MRAPCRADNGEGKSIGAGDGTMLEHPAANGNMQPGIAVAQDRRREQDDGIGQGG
jgi:hypothetical protein